MKAIKKNIEIGSLILKSKILRTRIPIFVSWSLTNRCNMHCSYCEIPSQKSGELSTQQVMDTLKKLSRHGTKVISFTGGEPLLRTDIGKIIDYAKSLGIFVKVNSNGLLVKEKIDEIQNADVLQLSFDGPKEVHDKQRGKGSYDKVMEAVRMAKMRKLKVYFNATITRHNVSHVPAIARKAKELQVPTSVQPVTHILFCTKGINKLYPEKDAFRNAVNYLMGERKRNKYILNSYKSLEYMSKWPIGGKIDCFAGKITYRIASDGGFLPCNRTTDKSSKYTVFDMKKAFSGKLDAVCNGCWCITALELNHAFSFRPEPIFNIIRLDFLK